MGGPGDVPSSIKEEPHPGPSGDVGIGRSAVGKHGVSQFQGALMELIDCSRRGHIRSKSGSRHRRVCTCGDEAARRRDRSRLRISACSLCHKISSDRFWGHWNCGADVRDWNPGPGRSAASLTVVKHMTPRTREIRKWPPVGEHRRRR